MNKKILTIVIPTYNMQDYLRRCLDSLLVDQERLNLIEVLVINDGSKDNSSAIAHDYEGKYPESFRVIDKENGNYGSCVNRGLKEAKGKYFRILDADDRFDTGALAQLVDVLATTDLDLVFSRCIHRNTDESIINENHYPSVVRADVEIDATQYDAIEEGYWPFIMHMMTYKTSVLRDVNLVLSEGISYSDNEYVFYPLEKVRTLIFVDIPLYQYTMGREGQTMTPALMLKRVKHFEKILDRMVVYLEEKKNSLPRATYINQVGVAFSMMHWMYSLLLSTDVDEESSKMLAKLERYSAAIPELQQRTTEIEKFGFHYVNYWRRTRRTLTHPISKLYMQLSRILSKFKRRFA